ncbi:STAS domain-containing protein, partial [Streptomyces cinereoruber]|uniref:STAS domain-containing protein n=1 Tax=Streptomyces cinereoruber TaxID=67260 RepID=UPI0036444AE8
MLLLSSGFDAESTVCLREALDAVHTPQVERLLLHLAGAGFGDSAFLHELTAARRRSGRLVLVGPLTGAVRRVLDLTGTRELFDIALGVLTFSVVDAADRRVSVECGVAAVVVVGV